MALYEYRCRDCGYAFEAFILTPEDTPSCPACGSNNLEKLLSTFAVGAKSQSTGPSIPPCPSGGCCDGRCGMM
jgi:putative FmdB family regulatory protein